MKAFHFDIGDTTSGPLGMTAVIEAETETEAVEIFRDAIGSVAEGHDLDPRDDNGDPMAGVKYMRIWTNCEYITAADIDEVEES